jgi:hypothetical protein
MTFRVHQVESLACDDCLTTLDDDAGLLIMTEDRDELVEHAREQGWTFTLIDEFCPDCAPPAGTGEGESRG